MNLAETQVAVRKFLIGVTIITFIYYSSKFLFFQSVDFYKKLNPPKKPEPAAVFGPVPQLKMSNFEINGTPSYILDTINGRLPDFPDRLMVYKVKIPEATLLSEQQVKQIARDLGFSGSFTSLSKSEFRWVDGTYGRTFTAHAITKSFKLETPISRISPAIFQIPTITQADATNMVSSFLRAKTLLSPEDLSNMIFTAIPSQISLGKLKESGSLSTSSKMIKINVYRRIGTAYNVLGPNPKDSLISFFVTNEGNAYKYPTINFTYWDANYQNGSEYYLSSIGSVWNAIQQGKGIVAYAKTKSSDYYDSPVSINIDTVEVREIYIAYYEQKDLPEYLQPIYVFNGQFKTKPETGQIAETGEIVIYYPAIRGDFVR